MAAAVAGLRLEEARPDLGPYEASALCQLRSEAGCSSLMTAYDLKEDFFDIYDEHPLSREDAEDAFDAWKASIPDDKAYDPFRGLAKAVENHREFIFNYRDCPSRISNGYTECANRLINETNMMGRGHSFETLRARTLYRSLSRHRGMALRLSSRLSEQEWVRLPQVSLRRCLSHPPVRGP